ncbi:MAG TPA: indole-3-glycerol phosphate synthase TrpC [Bryobacteraceae bacterium]|jgi:indole-3-glycerol phosphate synthase|nr:indole-3-glycerol phosphate synthase TrpC [Bryobacteraceae bacterium]
MKLRTGSGILAGIVQQKGHEAGELRLHSAELERRAGERRDRRDFAGALSVRHPAIIAEIKKASPSKGLLQPVFHPKSIAGAYARGGAACLSVLTDRKYFQGSLEDLETARDAAGLPVLRKDFTIDRLQIFEAAAHGADAILLIAAILDVHALRDFRELAEQFGMSALVEVHDEYELEKAIDSGASLIGVNNRNLDTFDVTLETSLRLSERIPNEALRVSESGIRTRNDIDLLRGAGYHAFLVGESLMRAPDPAAALSELMGAAT